MSLAQEKIIQLNDVKSIQNVKVGLYKIPLKEVLSDAKHGDHTHFELITCTIECDDGITGTGYTYTGGKGGSAIYHLLVDELVPFVKQQNPNRIEKIWEDMQYHLHYVGRGGLLSFAISAIDIALWDIRCKRLEAPLWQVVGGNSFETQCYAGGIDLNFSKEKLLKNIKSYIERGFTQVKIKVGQKDYKEDIARIKAVRELIGPDVEFMIDANYSLSASDAIRLSKSVEQYNIRWFEEPTLPDDLEGYAQISESTSIPLAMGENLHTVYEFNHAIQHAKLGFLQPDASNIGGVTGFLKVAQLAYANNLPICTHGMHELHVSLMASQPHACSMEVHSFPIDEYTTQPLRLVNGMAQAPDLPGTGVVFVDELITPHLVIES